VGFPDHFSGHAADYARYRPDYPDALFDYLGGLAPARRRAWDCATGNGQAAVALARIFGEVIATDASRNQLANAPAHPRVRYRVAPAEDSGIRGGSVELVTAAQSLHWFDRDRFWTEARRVLVPGGILAVWAYGLFRMAPEIEAVVRRLYREIVGPYWPAQRGLIERGYATIEFPFEEERPPAFRMEKEWRLEDLLGYLRTWSATRRFLEARGEDPVVFVERDLERAWGTSPGQTRSAIWDLQLRVGRTPERLRR
jgi:SAM-dependent methyltransferase